MPSFVRLCCAVAVVCLGAVAVLLAVTDIAGVVVRLLIPQALATIDLAIAAAEIGIEWVLWISALAALPCLAWVHAGPVTATRAFRSPVSVFPGAAVVAVVVVVALFAAAMWEGGRALPMVLRGVAHGIDAQWTAVPIMAALVGVLLTGGRVAGAAAVLSAPVVMLSLLGMLLEQSIARSTAGALLPVLLLAGALAPASIPRAGGVAWRLVWPLGAAALLPIAAFLMTGLFTPREVLSFALVGALVIGLTLQGLARGDNAWRFALTAVVEIGALVLAVAGCAAVMITLRLLAVGWGEPLAGLGAGAAPLVLALVALAYIALGAALTPVAALAVTLPFATACIQAGLAPLQVTVILAIAALLSLVVRMTAWRIADIAPENVRLSRTGGGIALGGGIAIIAVILVVPDALLALAQLM